MAARETHKGRAEWTRWAGTPNTVAQIAEQASELVRAATGGNPSVRIQLDAMAWESEFTDAQSFVDGLREEDIGDLSTIEIDVEDASHHIAVKLGRNLVKGASTAVVVQLNVAGPDRAWAAEARQEMTRAIGENVPRRRVLLFIGWGGAALLVIGGATLWAGSYGTPHKKTPVEAVGDALMIAGGALAGGAFLIFAALPAFVLLPEGGSSGSTRWVQWGRREAVWLFRALLLTLLGSGVTLLIQYFRK